MKPSASKSKLTHNWLERRIIKSNSIMYMEIPIMGVVTHYLANNIHEIKIQQSSSEAIDQLFEISDRIFTNRETENIYLLIDAREAKNLSLHLLAIELRTLSQRDGKVKPCIAIVAESVTGIQETSRMLKTILERDRVEFFTDIEKSRLWIELEMNRRTR